LTSSPQPRLAQSCPRERAPFRDQLSTDYQSPFGRGQLDLAVTAVASTGESTGGLDFPGEFDCTEAAAEVGADLDRGVGAERQRSCEITKVTSPISPQTIWALNPLREFGSSRSSESPLSYPDGRSDPSQPPLQDGLQRLLQEPLRSTAARRLDLGQYLVEAPEAFNAAKASRPDSDRSPLLNRPGVRHCGMRWLLIRRRPGLLGLWWAALCDLLRCGASAA
jgi:hypothetical protein